jgi:hypothetical protein
MTVTRRSSSGGNLDVMTARKISPQTPARPAGAVSRAQWLAKAGGETASAPVDSLADERERRIFNNAVIDLYARQRQPNTRRKAS